MTDISIAIIAENEGGIEEGCNQNPGSDVAGTMNIPDFNTARLKEIVFRNPNCKALTSEKRVGRLTKRYRNYGTEFLGQIDATCTKIAADEGRNGTNNLKSTQTLLSDLRVLVSMMTSRECELYTNHESTEALKIIGIHQKNIKDVIINQKPSTVEYLDQTSVNTDQADETEAVRLEDLPEIYPNTNLIAATGHATLLESPSQNEQQNTKESPQKMERNEIDHIAFIQVYGDEVIREKVLQLDTNLDSMARQIKLIKVIEVYGDVAETTQASDTHASSLQHSSPDKASVDDNSDQNQTSQPQRNVTKDPRSSVRIPSSIQTQVLTKYRDRFYKQSTQDKRKNQVFKNLFYCSDLYKGRVVQDIWGPDGDPTVLSRWAATLGRKWDKEGENVQEV